MVALSVGNTQEWDDLRPLGRELTFRKGKPTMLILIIILLPKPLGLRWGRGHRAWHHITGSPGSLLAGRLPLRLRLPLTAFLISYKASCRPSKSTLAARLPVFLFRNQLWKPGLFSIKSANVRVNLRGTTQIGKSPCC